MKLDNSNPPISMLFPGKYRDKSRGKAVENNIGAPKSQYYYFIMIFFIMGRFHFLKDFGAEIIKSGAESRESGTIFFGFF